MHKIKFDAWRIQLHKHGGSPRRSQRTATTTPVAGKSLMLTT
jgi:hypothetical protein